MIHRRHFWQILSINDLHASVRINKWVCTDCTELDPHQTYYLSWEAPSRTRFFRKKKLKLLVKSFWQILNRNQFCKHLNLYFFSRIVAFINSWKAINECSINVESKKKTGGWDGTVHHIQYIFLVPGESYEQVASCACCIHFMSLDSEGRRIESQ